MLGLDPKSRIQIRCMLDPDPIQIRCMLDLYKNNRRAGIHRAIEEDLRPSSKAIRIRRWWI